MKRIPSLIVAFLLIISGTVFADNLVQNPGFESGFVNWTENIFSLYAPPQVNSGQSAADTGCVGENCIAPIGGAYIQQALNTAAGATYNLSFYVAENSGPAAEMAVYWNGSLLADVMNPASNACIGVWSICHFVQYTYTGLLATSDVTMLRINGRQDPGYMIFDDFSVTLATSLPTAEPASAVLLVAVLFAAIVFRLAPRICSLFVRRWVVYGLLLLAEDTLVH